MQPGWKIWPVALLLGLSCTATAAHGQATQKAGSIVAPTPISRIAGIGDARSFGLRRPQIHCTRQEYEKSVAVAEHDLEAAEFMANEARDYVKRMRERIEAARKAGDKAAYEADSTALARFQKADLHRMTVTDPELAQEQLDWAKKVWVTDCRNPQAIENHRPADVPFDIPDVPDRTCTAAEKTALVEKAARAEKAAEQNRDGWYYYRVDLGRRIEFYRGEGKAVAGADKLIEILKKELDFTGPKHADAVKRVRAAAAAREKADRLEPAPCPPKGEARPAKAAGSTSSLPEQMRSGINALRGDPVQYVAALQSYRGSFKGNIGYTRSSRGGVATLEGTGAVDDAIGYLQMLPTRMPLEVSPLLTATAQALVDEQGPRGATGHLFADGTGIGDRAKRLGGDIFVSESVGYGAGVAEEMILRLIVDDGVRGRGHRKMLVSPEYRYVGIACGPHAKFGHMCVLDFSATADGRPVVPGSMMPPPPPAPPPPPPPPP